MVQKKIVYLFGAGATQAELSQMIEDKDFNSSYFQKHGLLISEISQRVTRHAKLLRLFDNLGLLFPSQGLSNIELLISLMEGNANQIDDSLKKTQKLKELVKSDIERVLTVERRKRFYLHKALLELDKNNSKTKTEEILGYITLNYDTVLDEAYLEIKDVKTINYCLSSYEHNVDGVPLLKLHGSFKWYSNLSIVNNFSILPLGIENNYLQLPYNYVWGYALEALSHCDILRVVGCSLSQNDYRLIDLLFKAQLLKKSSFEVHVINRDNTGTEIKRNYGFFQYVKNFSEIFKSTTTNQGEEANESFQNWLKLMGSQLSDRDINSTTYLKKLIT